MTHFSARLQHALLPALVLGALGAGCAAEAGDGIADLGSPGGKADGAGIREADIDLGAGEIQSFRVTAPRFEARLTQNGSTDAKLSAKHYDTELESDIGPAPEIAAGEVDGEVRRWTLRVHNEGTSRLRGTLTVESIYPAPADREGIPTTTSDVLYDNEFCTYADTEPYVKSVEWTHPTVEAATKNILNGWRSMFTYSQWNVPYDLEDDSTGSEKRVAEKRARNFIRVLCGEYRDHPSMLRARLEVVATAQHYAGAEEMTNVDTGKNLFTQLTYPAYVKMVNTMRTMHAYRQQRGSKDGYHYGFGEQGHGSRRVDESVAPWTQCEMKFMFEHYMTEGAPSASGTTYENEYDAYRASECSPEDFEWMFDFRGHVNFQPLWLSSNAYIHNSRRARGMVLSHDDNAYYLRPFATRRELSRKGMATFLFAKQDDFAEMMRASESGGGPILYITDEDTDDDNVLDYRLFDQRGCGDQGVSSPVPSKNCNMVPWETAEATPNVTGHVTGFSKSDFERPDLGFLDVFTTFDDRMARINQALDRHSNWGPTGYYMKAGSDDGDPSPRFFGAYSPFVASSYDVSASDGFVRRDFPTTDEYERGRAKWLFVIRFRADHYYDEQDLKAGRSFDLDTAYFNETSLSNDFYRERALDHFGTIPGEEAYAQVYLTYGHRGEQPPTPTNVPAP
ncbi:MAG: hypothetical protein KC416_06410 [Myxococcales bacterium]|nr:hypothetical protein [Myxococcales bacterium]